MGDDRQTFSGWVRAWECDTTEHFTVAYYYQRFSQATHRLLLGMGWDFKEQRFPASTDCYTRFLQELNQGDSFEIRSGVIESDSQSMKLGHKLFNSETGELCTTMEQVLNEGPRTNMKSFEIDWDGEPREDRGELPAGAKEFCSAMDVVRPEEVDWSGQLDLSSNIHRFSAANQNIQTRFGMSRSYADQNRIGFSTFEFQLSFPGTHLRSGEAQQVFSSIAHVGRTTMRTVHRMERSGGETVALLSIMGVHLDLDRRRPCPFPEELVSRAREIMGE